MHGGVNIERKSSIQFTSKLNPIPDKRAVNCTTALHPFDFFDKACGATGYCPRIR
jgi:hypothetical protein